MATSFVPLEEVASRIGLRAKQLRSLCAERGLDVGAGEVAPGEVAELLLSLPVERQRHIRAHQLTGGKISKRGWNEPYSVLEAFKPTGFKPATASNGKLALQMPLTYHSRSHASLQELATWWSIPEAKVRELAKALNLTLEPAPAGLAELYEVIDLVEREANSEAFQFALSRLREEAAGKVASAQRSQKAGARKVNGAFERESRASLGKRERDVQRVRQASLEEQIASRVEVNVQARTPQQAPEAAIYYAGATNSGKTYAALADLSAAFEAEVEHKPGSFIYAGPLRMLAYEVYQKLAAKHGEENVGFLTGEEQLNPTAPILACTVEMAPMRGQMLVLDESHWIAESARGQHWTDLLLGSVYKSYHVLTAREALPTLQQLLGDAHFSEVREFERKTPLVYRGPIDISDVSPRSAVVAFSRKSVYAVASMLERQGRKVGVVYGALPLAVRKEQIERYLRGDYEVMVVTDVIGHGINLPIDRVVFAQSEKFDGIERRDLKIWEAAQIAGRAGRFGLSDEGAVHLLAGRDWFSRDEKLIRKGALAGAGAIPTDLEIRRGMVAPSLHDLHVSKPEELTHALQTWQKKAAAALAHQQVEPSTLAEVYALLFKLAEDFELPLSPSRGASQWPVAVADVWQLISGPFNPSGEAIRQIFSWLAAGKPQVSPELNRFFAQLVAPLGLGVRATGLKSADQVSELEKHVGSIRELKMARLMFGRIGGLLLPELLDAEDRLNEAIDNALGQLISAGAYGTCRVCGQPASPWFNLCEDCHYQQRR